ncbi:MAG: hypothetical protein DKT66_24365 [Candidatus Melainabacteria bacterium]|nr:MAG: hypothetical protein DKT66_24365 [Candidatus Melainabacteria bacterium]
MRTNDSISARKLELKRERKPDLIRVRLEPQQNAYRMVLDMVSLERRSRAGRKEVTSHHKQAELVNTLLEIRSLILGATKGETEDLSYGL